MCDSCIAGAAYFGEVLPGWQLERATRDGNYFKAGEWGLVWCNDPSFIFVRTPTPQPPECEDESDPEYDAKNDAYGEWLDTVEGILVCNREDARTLPFNDFYQLMKAGVEAGFDQEKHGHFQFWLTDHVGKFITANPTPRDRSSWVDHGHAAQSGEGQES